VREAIARACGSDVVSSRRVPGGDINDAFRVTLADGRELFVKTRTDAPAGMYAAEAAGLRWLADANALPVPSVVAVDEKFLALGWVETGAPGADHDEALGRGLARLHRAGADHFGFDGPTFIGPIRFPNGAAASWPEYYARDRVRPVADLAESRGALPSGARAAIERLCERMSGLCGPAEPPSRLHGDLWSGNVMTDAAGDPWLVDPAAYGGHREIDLAMLRLFGSPSQRFLSAYEEVAPLADGHGERVPLYQVLPLLVHAALFGGGYGASVARAVARYV
jgi:fructosamine-3-kinase